MNQPTSEQNIKLLKMMKQALDDDLLIPSYKPLLEVRFPTRKTFQLGCDLQTGTGQLIPYSSLDRLARLTQTSAELDRRCPPWRAKRRRVVPGSREATRDTRRAEGAKGDPKGASERGVQSYGRPVC
ncbi:MAG: hypothetical protein DSZ02_00160, partial [Gammaproteobacteria bacterium]